jgi:hypothetical protein
MLFSRGGGERKAGVVVCSVEAEGVQCQHVTGRVWRALGQSTGVCVEGGFVSSEVIMPEVSVSVHTYRNQSTASTSYLDLIP